MQRTYKEYDEAFESEYDHTTNKWIISNNKVIAGLVGVLNTLIWSTFLPILLMLKKYENLAKIKADTPFTFTGYGVRITFELIKKNQWTIHMMEWKGVIFEPTVELFLDLLDEYYLASCH